MEYSYLSLVHSITDSKRLELENRAGPCSTLLVLKYIISSPEKIVLPSFAHAFTVFSCHIFNFVVSITDWRLTQQVLATNFINLVLKYIISSPEKIVLPLFAHASTVFSCHIFNFVVSITDQRLTQQVLAINFVFSQLLQTM